jgi:hypothetical protein
MQSTVAPAPFGMNFRLQMADRAFGDGEMLTTVGFPWSMIVHSMHFLEEINNYRIRVQEWYE